MRDTRPRPWRGYCLVGLAAALWAAGGVTAKWMLTSSSAATAAWVVRPLGLSIEPVALSSARALSAFCILLVFVALRRPSALRVALADLPFLAVFGVVGLAGVHFTYFKAISLTSVPVAILLEYLAPVLVLLVGVAFMGHRFTWNLPAAVALSVTGCALVTGVVGPGTARVPLAGIAWGLAAAVLFAGYSLMGGVAAGRFSPYTTLLYGLGFASLFWLVTFGVDPVVRVFSHPSSAAAIVVMAVISTVVPFAAFLAALRDISPTSATITSTIEPVLAGIGAAVLFGERMGALQLVGGCLVLAAIVVAQLSERLAGPVLPVRE